MSFIHLACVCDEADVVIQSHMYCLVLAFCLGFCTDALTVQAANRYGPTDWYSKVFLEAAILLNILDLSVFARLCGTILAEEFSKLRA